MSGKLTISLAALRANYRSLAEASGSRVAGVVKANAYGLGADAVASALAEEGCETFFVATPFEGVRLRATLNHVKIYVLNGVNQDSCPAFLEHELTPVLNTPAQLKCWTKVDRSAALHLDTGMQRLGLAASELFEVERLPGLKVELIMSHFARADEQDPDLAQLQVQRFESLSLKLRRQFPAAAISMSNSAAAMAGAVGDDVVRGGIALYGSNPFSDAPNPMQAVVHLEAQILQVRDVAAGTPVGYGGTYICPTDRRLATVGVGYADGVPRLLSNCGEVVIHQQRCPIVGRVSMDMISVDVTEISTVAEGDWVEVLGETIGVDEVAHHARTLGYEILTGLDAAQRLERVYSPQKLGRMDPQPR